jgi:hypothetical protein
VLATWMDGVLSKTRPLRWDALRLLAVCISDLELLFLILIILAWGDADALAEAGFCYAQGVGCKKDLKKSAKFYRQAEAKGISMVGNSWYVSIPANCSARLTVWLGSTNPNTTTIPRLRLRTSKKYPPKHTVDRQKEKKTKSRGINRAREPCSDGGKTPAKSGCGKSASWTNAVSTKRVYIGRLGTYQGV